MKTLYVVGGAMGAGKTTTCRLLRDRLDVKQDSVKEL